MNHPDPACRNAIRFFAAIGAPFGEMNLHTWGWLLLIPGALIVCFIAWKAKPQGIFSALVLVGFSVLLTFYVFMPGVDYIQFLIFFLMAFSLMMVPGQLWKLLSGIALLLPIICFFREYYGLMAGFAAFVFIVAILYRKPKNFREQAIFLCILACLIVVIIFVIRLFAKETIDRLFTVRTTTNQTLGSNPAPNKLILDVFPLDASIAGFLANYIVAAVRLLVPVELCAQLSDVPFAVFQVVLISLIIYQLAKSREVKGRTAVYSIIFAFFLMSFFFEPDFGSWFRHEAAAFPILWLGVGKDVSKKQEKLL